MTDRTDQIAEFLGMAGWGGADRAILAADASFRRYDRIIDGDRRAVLMDAPPPMEDVQPFLMLARHLVGLGYSAPRILAEDAAAGFLLLEDLGDATFTRLLAGGEDETALYLMATDLLIDLHRRPMDQAVPIGCPDYDDARLLDEAALLTNWYMPQILGAPLSAAASADYRNLWKIALGGARAVPESLVLRDYHVDNLMRVDDRQGIAACGLLDFQDAVRGPVTYDLVSLIEDARRDVSPAVADSVLERYLAAFPALDRDDFGRSLAVLGAQRHAKVIGIFTRLCARDGKADYLRHIPRVWRLLEAACIHPSLASLRGWLDSHIPADKRGIPSCEAPS
ncbi:MAG: phosphotransferase [Proteobacteria bacterium]|nr:phosphotransferase [Pseudomonadota bacterium]